LEESGAFLASQSLRLVKAIKDATFEFEIPLSICLINFKHQPQCSFDLLTFTEDVFFDIYDFSLYVAFKVMFKRSHLSEESYFVGE